MESVRNKMVLIKIIMFYFKLCDIKTHNKKTIK